MRRFSQDQTRKSLLLPPSLKRCPWLQFGQGLDEDVRVTFQKVSTWKFCPLLLFAMPASFLLSLVGEKLPPNRFFFPQINSQSLRPLECPHQNVPNKIHLPERKTMSFWANFGAFFQETFWSISSRQRRVHYGEAVIWGLSRTLEVIIKFVAKPCKSPDSTHTKEMMTEKRKKSFWGAKNGCTNECKLYFGLP